MIRDKGVFLGYYRNLPDFLSYHPHSIPGGCFVNGETLSLWVWDEVGRQWVDSNRADNWLSGLVDDAETFVPMVKTGVKTAYLYMSNGPGVITFTNFLSDGDPLKVTVDGVSVVMLFWNGDYWEYEVATLGQGWLEDYAKKDLSNVRLADFREKGVYPVESFVYSVDNDHSVSVGNKEAFAALLGSVSENLDSLLYAQSIASSAGDLGLSAAAVSLIGNDPLSYSVTFVGNDAYWHELRVDGSGAITRQYAYRLDDMATKDWLTSQGYLPTRIVDMGEYSSSEGFDFTDPLLSELAAAINAVSEGKATLLLKGSTPYGDPLFFTGVSVRIEDGVDYRLTFLFDDGRSYSISFEAGYPDTVTQGFVQSGTITSEAYTDTTDYEEI